MSACLTVPARLDARPKTQVQAREFGAWPADGLGTRASFGLRIHRVWYRSFRIRELP